MALLKKIYSDIDLTFARNPITGDVAISYDENAVIRSVRNLVLTNFYERPFQPSVGSNVEAHLFEPASSITAAALESEIRVTIENHEPRAKLSDINIVALEDLNTFYIEITFFIGNNTQPTTVNLLLERSR